MANRFEREAITDSDKGVWAQYEIAQNKNNIGALTVYFFGTGSYSTGRIGFDDGVTAGTIIIDTAGSVSLAGISNGNWAKIEVSLAGTTPVFSASDIAGATDPTVFPTIIRDGLKQGYYDTADKRIVALAWKTAGGAIDGLINFDSNTAGYTGRAESVPHRAAKDLMIPGIGNANQYVGLLHILDEADRPASFVLNNGQAATWTVVDFSSYVPVGVKALLLKAAIRWTGDGVLDDALFIFRQNGSSETNTLKTSRFGFSYTNMPNTIINFGNDGQVTLLCDSDGIIEYQKIGASTGGGLYLMLEGYYI